MVAKKSNSAKRLLKIVGSIIFLICSFNLFNAKVVHIESDMPDTISAGMTIPVTITINKGNIEGFGRYTNTLPKGFSATSSDPNFTFANNTVTILWVKLPETNSFTITYNIIVPEKVKNSFAFTAKFGYVQDNEKRFAELTPRTINISDDAVDLQIAQNNTPTTITPNDITCYRTIGIYNNEATISVRISQTQPKSMCKIEEMLPDGYTFSSIDNAGANVSTVQNVVRYMWTESPSENEFSVIYKISANKGYDINDLVLNGAYSVLDNDKTTSYVILDNNSSIDESTGTFSEVFSESKKLTINENTNGKYSNAESLQDIKSLNYNTQQASFFANTDAVNTMYSNNFPTETFAQDATANVSSLPAKEFSIDDINLDNIVASNEQVEQKTNEQAIKTEKTTEPTKEDINQFQNTLNIPAPTVAKAEKEQEYEITQTTERTTTSEIVTESKKPELINNIYAVKSTRPTMTTIEAEPNQITTQTTTETITQVTTTTTTIAPIKDTKKTTKPTNTIASTSNKNTTLSNKNNNSQQKTKVTQNTNKNGKVTYRVQVAASHKQLKNQQNFFAKRNVNEKVTVERIDNWYKYTINSFDTYLNARNHRNSIWEQTPIKGAFVVAYNGKQRITVQEALMLTNQKWAK